MPGKGVATAFDPAAGANPRSVTAIERQAGGDSGVALDSGVDVF